MGKILFAQEKVTTLDNDLRIALGRPELPYAFNIEYGDFKTLLEAELNINTDIYLSAGVTGTHPVVTDNGDGTISVTGCQACLYPTQNHTGGIDKYVVAAANNLVINSGSLIYVTIKLDAGVASYYVTNDVNEINESNVIPCYTVLNYNNNIHVLDWDSLADGLANKINKRLVKTERFKWQSGFALSEKGTRNIEVTAGTVWNGAVEHDLSAFDSTLTDMQRYYHVSGVWQRNLVSQYDNLYYDDGTDLVELTVNRYTVNRVYRTVDVNQEELILLLGNQQFLTVADAKQSQPPSDVPDVVRGLGLLVGRIIVQKNATTGTIESAFERVFVGSTLTSHNDLSDIDGGGTYHLSESQYNNFVSRKRQTPTVVTGTPNTLTIDFDGNNEVIAKKSGGGGIDVTTDFTLVASNFTNAEAAQVFLSIDTATSIAITLSGNMITSDDLSTLATGEYQLVMTYDGGTFHVVISEPETI